MPYNLTTMQSIFCNNKEITEIRYNGSLVYNKQSGPDYTEPFYVENTDNESKTLTIKMEGTSNYHPNPVTVEFSTNRTDWELLGTTAYGAKLTHTVNSGQKLYLRSNTVRWGSSSYNSGTVITGLSKVGGNIMSLLYGSNFTGQEISFPASSTATFKRLFYQSNVVDASKLLLPATVLTTNCYQHMFAHCASLTAAPALPATTLVTYCYDSMFDTCTSLTTAPELPATTLTENCYSNMFYDCTALTYIKCMATSLSANRCLYNWLRSASSTGTFTKAAGVEWPTGVSGIPSGWTVVEV